MAYVVNVHLAILCMSISLKLTFTDVDLLAHCVLVKAPLKVVVDLRMKAFNPWLQLIVRYHPI